MCRVSVCSRDVVCVIVFGGSRPASICKKASNCLGNPPTLHFAPLLSEFLQALDLINALDENKLTVIVKRLVKNVGEKSASFTAQELEQLQDHLQLAEGQVNIVVLLSLLRVRVCVCACVSACVQEVFTSQRTRESVVVCICAIAR